MKRQDLYLSVAAMLTLGTFMPLAAAPAMAEPNQAQNLTPEQKAAIEAKKKKGQATQQGQDQPQNAQPQQKMFKGQKAPVGVPNSNPPPVINKQVTSPPPFIKKSVTPPAAKKVFTSPPDSGRKIDGGNANGANAANGNATTQPHNERFRKFNRDQAPLVKKAAPVNVNPPNAAKQADPDVKTNPAYPSMQQQRQFNPAYPHVGTPQNNPAQNNVAGAGRKFEHGPANLEVLKAQRTEVVSKRGNAKVIKEQDRTIVKQNNKAVILHNEATRLQRVAPNATVTKQGRNNVTVIQRANNVQIFNVTDSNGQLIKRYRRDGDGRETMLIDNESRRHKSRWGRNLAIGLGVGAGIIAGAAILNAVADVPPPHVDVERRKYIVDYEDASDDDVYEAFSAPPVDRIERRYTLDEVRATPALRDRMRRVDLSDINFDTGSWEVDESQYRKLERVARALLRVIDRNPNEVFMIEGYTDAVGSEEDNLSLSDRRAESVAVILSEQFNVPAENLTTQGYGEQYLKVPTDGPERANRRVAIRRITPLISQDDRGGDRRDDDRRYEERRYEDRR